MTTGTACTLRLLCSIVVFALSVSGLADAAEGLPEGSALHGERSLALMVREFLTTTDSVRASALLESILKEPGATLEGVADIIKAGPTYRPQPVGMLPSQPIQVRGHRYWYGLHVPSSYTSEKPYALVICLHGLGFTGDSYLERWRDRLGEGYILACPTMIRGDWYTRVAEELVLATIRAVQARYHIDPDRVFLTGMSNGGIGVWLIGCHNAARFAGLAPMASGLDHVLFPFLQNLEHTPVYILHGRKDHVMSVELSRSIAKVLTEYGYAFTYREHDRSHPMAGGHFFPREELPELVRWFDQQRRRPYAGSLTVVRDASHLTRFGWLRIDATDRIAAFPENLIEGRDELIVNRVYAGLKARIAAPNRITVETERVRRYTLFLNEELVDFAKPVTVATNGRITYSGPAVPQVETLLREARHRKDRSALFPAKLTLSVENDS